MAYLLKKGATSLYIRTRMTYLEHILFAEEDYQCAFLLQIALKQAGLENPIELFAHDHQVIDYLSHTGQFADRPASPPPIAIILALRLPFKNDFEVLRWIRRQSGFRQPPFTVLSGLDYANERGIAHPARRSVLQSETHSFSRTCSHRRVHSDRHDHYQRS